MITVSVNAFNAALERTRALHQLTSVPLILGEPSCRRVASVLCLRRAKCSSTRAANSGSAA
jgi:hypothetical protein